MAYLQYFMGLFDLAFSSDTWYHYHPCNLIREL